jgi:hypothetical protein
LVVLSDTETPTNGLPGTAVSSILLDFPLRQQPITTSTAAGKCFFDMLGAFSEFETNRERSARRHGESGAEGRKAPIRAAIGASSASQRTLVGERPKRSSGDSGEEALLVVASAKDGRRSLIEILAGIDVLKT